LRRHRQDPGPGSAVRAARDPGNRHTYARGGGVPYAVTMISDPTTDFPAFGSAQSNGAADYPGLDDWRSKPISQQPTWEDPAEFEAALAELSSAPPLVFAGEVDQLRTQLAAAARGEAFLLQGGDCAETFAGATANKISAKVKTILQ